MRARRAVIGVFLAALLVGSLAGPAAALKAPPVPTVADLRKDIKSIVPKAPSVGVPNVSLQNPQIPALPYVAPPAGLTPALGFLSPANVISCQAAYLGPLGGVVAMTVLLGQLPDGTLPVQPSFLQPLFSPIVTACVLAPYPTVSSCGQDAAITKRLQNLPVPAIPSVSGVAVPDPFETAPAPFASLVVEVLALQTLVNHYVYDNKPGGLNQGTQLTKTLNCKA